jgi:sialic acid synthase SpsE
MIIAELGHNHQGSYDLASRYVESLIETDIDAITLQMREPAFYKDNFADYRLTHAEYEKLGSKITNANKILGLAVSETGEYSNLKADFFKILSKDLQNLKFIDTITNFISKKPIHFSTGLSNFDIIEEALDFCARKGIQDTKLIHTRLSNNIEEVNLKAITSMRNRFGNIIAFGNHCKNTKVLYTAVAYEPTDYYFYVKDRNQKHPPDDLHAVYLDEVQQYCADIKELSLSLGTGKKAKTNITIKGH